MILLSIGHSAAARGAHNKKFNVSEYDLCKVMVNSACDIMHSKAIDCVVLDANNKFPYHNHKVMVVNACKPQVAVEFHLNSYPGSGATYSSCFFWGQNKAMSRLSAFILANCKTAFEPMKWGQIKSVGLPEDGYDLDRYWFITETKYPALIVEPLFISNNEQAAWLTSRGAPEAVGMLIAEGILSWMAAENLISASSNREF